MVTATTIKKGYKQTELGFIPNDWEIFEVKDVTISHKQGYYTKDRYIESGIRLVRITDLHNPKIDYAAMPTLRISKRDFDLYKINVGDFLFARSGAIGRYGIVHEKVDAIFGSYIIRFVFDSSKLINEYFGFVYETDVIWKQLLSITQGSSNININATNIKSLKVAIPLKKEEQNAIATVLSDTDALIERLEKLIAKKIAIKQGTMQQLLTGKKRLPGFSGEWKVKKLEEVVDFLDGKRRPIKDIDRAKMRGQYPYYGASGIIDYVDDYIFDENLILLGEDGENIISRNCRLAFQISGKVWVNNHVHVLKPKPDTDIAFLTEYLESLDYGLYNSGTAQPKLNQKVCSSIPVILPSYPEQTAIATILSDMDAEIESLEQNRDKYTMLKQGMMQQLLTGRIRIHATN